MVYLLLFFYFGIFYRRGYFYIGIGYNGVLKGKIVVKYMWIKKLMWRKKWMWIFF